MKRNVKRHVVVQPPDPTIRLVPLTHNQNAIVDASDYDWLMQWNWQAQWHPSTNSYRALHSHPLTFMHRAILNATTRQQVDHINHNTLDNRRTNLRVVDNSQNAFNRKANASSKSGLKGVWWNKHKKKWMAKIKFRGIRFHVGYFNSPELAALAYNEAAQMIHGSFALLNPVKPD